VQIFFYPALFANWQKKLKLSQPARVALAVFVSVGVGNFIVHLMMHLEDCVELGLWAGIVHNSQFALYCFVLSVIVAASQINGLRRKKSVETRASRLANTALVLTVYALLSIFDDIYAGNIKNNLKLLASAVGLGG
jgi:hypothetical protein